MVAAPPTGPEALPASEPLHFYTFMMFHSHPPCPEQSGGEGLSGLWSSLPRVPGVDGATTGRRLSGLYHMPDSWGTAAAISSSSSLGATPVTSDTHGTKPASPPTRVHHLPVPRSSWLFLKTQALGQVAICHFLQSLFQILGPGPESHAQPGAAGWCGRAVYAPGHVTGAPGWCGAHQQGPQSTRPGQPARTSVPTGAHSRQGSATLKCTVLPSFLM